MTITGADPSDGAEALPASGFDAAPGQFELRVPRVGRFLVADGCTIRIARHPAAGDDALRLFLFGTAFGALLQQRGVLPLHGSAVCKDGRSLIIMGVSSAGKSSLSAALGRHGWRLQSDDISAVGVDNGIARSEAAFPRRKMWPDMLMKLGDDPEAHPPVRSGLEKRNQIVSEENFLDASTPVAGVIALSASRASMPVLTPVNGPPRMMLLKRHTFRGNLRGPLETHLPQFAITARLAEQARVWRLQRPRAGGSPAVLAEFLASHLEDWPFEDTGDS